MAIVERALLRTRRWCSGCGLIICALLVTASPALRAQSIEWIVLDGWEGELGLRARFEDETRERIGSADLEETEETWEERIGLRLDGSIYHPRFLEYDVYGAFLLEQESLDSNATSVKRDSTDSEYDILLSVLKEHPVSLRLGARQKIREVRQSFFQTTELTNTNLEAALTFKHSWFPFRLEARRDEVKGDGFRDTDERRDTVTIEGRHLGPLFSLDARAEYGETDLFTTDQNFITRSAQTSMRRRWGRDLRNLATATGHLREQAGTIDTETRNATLSSRHRHGESLSSEGRILYQDSSALGADNQGLAEELILTHQLYESLTTTVTSGASQDDFDGGETDTVYGGVEMRYRKRIPGGTVHIGLEARRDLIDENGLGTTGSIVDEPHEFTFGVPIFLDRAFIDVSTLIVTDAAGTFIYTEGSDYLVSSAGELTRIDIPVTSLIISGDTLLFTYAFQTAPDREYRRDRTSADLAIDIGTQVNLYGRISRLEENLESGTGSSDLDDVRRGEVGMVLGNSRRRATVRYSSLDSRFNPVERLQGTVAVSSELPWISHAARGTARIDIFRSRFPDDHAVERGSNAVARIDLSFSRGWTGRAFVEYRLLDDRVEESSGFFGEVGLRYGSRAWSFDAVLQQTITDFEISTDEDRTRFEFRAVRRFGGRLRR